MEPTFSSSFQHLFSSKQALYMSIQPGAYAPKGFNGSARMQILIGKAPANEHRDLNALQIRRDRLKPYIVLRPAV
jgi:hypothetical protein